MPVPAWPHSIRPWWPAWPDQWPEPLAVDAENKRLERSTTVIERSRVRIRSHEKRRNWELGNWELGNWELNHALSKGNYYVSSQTCEQLGHHLKCRVVNSTGQFHQKKYYCQYPNLDEIWSNLWSCLFLVARAYFLMKTVGEIWPKKYKNLFCLWLTSLSDVTDELVTKIYDFKREV